MPIQAARHERHSRISDADIILNRSVGYQLCEGRAQESGVSPTYNRTAGGTFYFNVLDLARWDAALYTERQVKKSGLDQMGGASLN
jgi:hypothetical protein